MRASGETMKLTEDDFIILPEDTTGKIHAKLSRMKEILDKYEKARLCDDLCKILMNHVGEDGDNEGAIECLNRISEKARKWDNLRDDVSGNYPEFEQNQKLRERVESQIKFRLQRLPTSDSITIILQKLLIMSLIFLSFSKYVWM